MPRVPYQPFGDVAAQPMNAPLLNVNAPPAAFGTTIAQAVDHLGTTVDKVGNELFNRADAMQQLRNESEATEALAKYELGANERSVNFRALRGRGAIDGFEPYRQGLDELRTGIRDGLSNDMVRKMYDRSALFVMNRSIMHGGDHAASENLKYHASSAQSKISSAIDVSRSSLTEDELNTNLDSIEQETRKLAGPGVGDMDDATRDQLIFKHKSEALANWIIAKAHDDPLGAGQIFDRRAGELHSTDYNRAYRIVHSELMDTGARNIANSNMRDIADPEGFLQKRAKDSTVHVMGIQPEFAKRLQAGIVAAEQATGQKIQINSLVRTREEQAELRAKFERGEGPPANKPGESTHEAIGLGGLAADIHQNAAGEWLRNNAGKFGLVFPHEGEPWHAQLALNIATPERQLPTREISERQVAGMARQKAEAQRPGDVDFADAAERHSVQVYKQNRQFDLDDRRKNLGIILDWIASGAKPQTIDDLRREPEVGAAYEQLEGKDQLRIQKEIAKSRTAPSDPIERARIRGMSYDRNQIANFLDLSSDEIMENPKLNLKDKAWVLDRQQKLQAKAEEDPRIAYAMGPNGIADLIPADTKKDKDAMAVLHGAMEEQLRQYQDVYKTQPSSEEIRKIGQRLLFEQRPGGGLAKPDESGDLEEFRNWPAAAWKFFFGSGSGSLLGIEVPSADYQRIKSLPTWASEGVTPTDNAIRTIYITEQYEKLYGGRR